MVPQSKHKDKIFKRRRRLWSLLTEAGRRGHYPTYRELQDLLYYSTTSLVLYDVQYLVGQGLVAPRSGRARSFRILIPYREQEVNHARETS